MWNGWAWDSSWSQWDEDGRKNRWAEAEEPSTRVLRRRTTEEGRNYDMYTYLGGDSKASLPSADRAKLLHHILGGSVGILSLHSLPGEVLDAALFLLTGQQPTMTIRSVSTNPLRLRDEFRDEYLRRRERKRAAGLEDDVPNQLLNMSDPDDHMKFVEHAMSIGFRLFQHPERPTKRPGNALGLQLHSSAPVGPAFDALAAQRQLIEMQMELARSATEKARLELALREAQADPKPSSADSSCGSLTPRRALFPASPKQAAAAASTISASQARVAAAKAKAAAARAAAEAAEAAEAEALAVLEAEAIAAARVAMDRETADALGGAAAPDEAEPAVEPAEEDEEEVANEEEEG